MKLLLVVYLGCLIINGSTIWGVELPQSETEKKVRVLISKLNDDPDILHAEITPAVRQLGEMGIPALEPLLEIAIDGDESSRMRACSAIAKIIRNDFQSDLKQRASSDQDWPQTIALTAFWKSIGYLEYTDPRETRIKVVNSIRMRYGMDKMNSSK